MAYWSLLSWEVSSARDVPNGHGSLTGAGGYGMGTTFPSSVTLSLGPFMFSTAGTV